MTLKDEDLIELRKRIRHSAAHVMADVVTRMFPKVKLAIGPPTDDGFYYDFDAMTVVKRSQRSASMAS